MPAAIFSSGAVRILKDLFRFKSGKELIVEKTNAQVSSGISAPIGSAVLTNEGRLYIKDGASDTDWNLTPFSLGVSGGQVIIGGVDSGDDLSLQSTSDATKGRIIAKDPINFDPAMTAPTYSEGNVSWSSTDKTLEIQTGLAGTTLQVGQEIYVYARNNTGSQINNGQPVYINGNSAGIPTIDLAQAHLTEKSKCVGIATMDIADSSSGFITAYGLVRDVDTSTLSVGEIYLSDTDGVLSNSVPTDGSYPNSVGTVLVSDASNGIIFVNPVLSELTTEVTDTNGFPEIERDNTEISFVDGTRTFTISAPVEPLFHFYEMGIKYEKTTAQSVVIDNTEGMHSIYFDGGTLTSIANASPAQFEDIVLNHAFVAIVYWDATSSTGIFLGDERHAISMSPKTHLYLHLTRGTQFVSGLAIGDIISGADGSLDSHAQFGVATGTIFDEDIEHNPPAIASTVGLDIYALDGANANLRKYTEAGFSVLTDVTAGVGATGRLVYNQFTGGSWQLTTVADNNYVLCHVFALNGVSGGQQWGAIIGQNTYANGVAARTGAETEISTLVSSLPLIEMVPVGTIIFQTRDIYTNSVNARIIQTDSGDDYIDWRTTEVTGGAAPTNHNNLSSLQLAASGVTYGHIDDQAQTIAGVKNFTNGIKLANSIVTVNNILDEDNMASNSETALATQQSIKAYADSIAASSTIYINQPSITAPVNGALSITFSSNITTSAFSVANSGTDTHESTDWEFSEQDGTIILPLYEDTVNKTSLNISASLFTASKTYRVRCRHVGATYGESQWSDYIYFTTSATLNHVDTPSITNPADGETDFEPMGDAITGSAYSHTGDATHVHSDWEMLNTSTKVVDASSYNDTTNKLSINFNNSLLGTNQNYLIRTRQNGSGTGDSLWSDYVNVKTPAAFPGVDTPTVSYPTPALTGVKFDTPFSISALSLSNQASQAADHQSTTWQCASDSGFSTIVEESVDDAVNLTSYTFDSSNFSTSTTYYFRALVKDANYGSSSYSSTITFTTAATFTIVDTPTVIYPAAPFTGIDMLTPFQISALSLTPSGAEDHQSTTWQIASDSGFSSIVEQSVNDTTNLTNYTFNQANFSTSTTYYFRALVTDTNIGSSSYSSTVTFTTASSFAAKTWSVTGNYIGARRNMESAGGTTNAGFAATGQSALGTLTDTSANFNGTTWSSSGTVNTSRDSGTAFGTQSSGVLAAGFNVSTLSSSETYNGSTWSTGNAMSTGSYNLASAGTSTAGIVAGGDGATTRSEEYASGTWSLGGTLNAGKNQTYGTGGQITALVGGDTTTSGQCETYNGTAWSTTDTMNAIYYGCAMIGDSLVATAFGGDGATSYLTTTEEYASGTWSTSAQTLNTGRSIFSSCGNGNTNGVAITGQTSGATQSDSCEKWS